MSDGRHTVCGICDRPLERCECFPATRAGLISACYVDEQRRLHAAPRGYGGRGSKWAEVVVELATEFHCSSVLDYGCGQGSLAKAIRANLSNVSEYDPAIPGKDTPPGGVFDLVVCTDVLEHIEPERISTVLAHLASLTGRALFAVVSLVPTAKMLSDGRQAHILLRSVDWWKYQFAEHDFRVSRTVRGRDPLKDHKQFAAVLTRRQS